jgi:serine protease Do
VISVPISKGSSGGGLFDRNGRLIGITTLSPTKGQNLNFAMPSNRLQKLISPPRRSRADGLPAVIKPRSSIFDLRAPTTRGT